MSWTIITIGTLYLLVLLALGIVARRANERIAAGSTNEFLLEYYLAGRNLGWVALLFTSAATFYSVGTFIGAPGLAYSAGYVWPLAVQAQHLTLAVLFLVAGVKFAIVARNLGFVTPLDFLRARYRNDWVVYIGALGTLFFLTIYIAPQFVGGARIFEAVTGLPYRQMLFVFLVVVAAYTLYGGFRAVVLTDILQGVLMTVGAVLIWYFLVKGTGGFRTVQENLIRIDPELVRLGEGSFATVISGYLVFSIAVLGLPHMSVRAMAYRSSRDMYRAVLYGAVLATIFSSTFMLLGTLARGLFPDLEAPDLAIPMLITTFVPPVLAGLLLMAPLAAIMSTIDSMLLLNTSVVAKDIYLNYVNPRATVRQIRVLSAISGVAITLIVLYFALTPPPFLENLVIYALGGLACTFWAPFVFGLYWRRGNQYGALAAMVLGIPSYILIDRLVDTGSLQALVIALPVAIGVYVVASLLTPAPPPEVIRQFWGKAEAPQTR
ncbi:MAG TPA: sodium/pantothenate symporter [Longimicrobiales bacterium]|nr:sodium/pantothenate symporter [Longimicrobiales bacterium]